MGCEGCSFKSTIIDIKDASSFSEKDLIKHTLNTSYDWLGDLPDTSAETDKVEVTFKNNRKEIYRNTLGLVIKRGDIVAVQADYGYDVGIVNYTGKLAEMKYKSLKKKPDERELPKVFRVAKSHEVQKWKEARGMEHSMMVKSRQLVTKLGLDMKISDVELRADQKKAVFHYIAEGRVDFRELIKVYRSEFKVTVEMHQIGARQEAGMVGGIGSCGRELCCSSWRKDFDSVSSIAARKQDLPESSQRLLGKCGKLKCCLMYELDQYEEAWKDVPADVIELDMAKGIARKEKIDLLKKVIYYSYPEETGTNFVGVPLKRVKEIINLNKRGVRPESLLKDQVTQPEAKYTDVLGDIEEVQKSLQKNRRKKRTRNNNRNSKNAGAANSNENKGGAVVIKKKDGENPQANAKSNRPPNRKPKTGQGRRPSGRKPGSNSADKSGSNES